MRYHFDINEGNTLHRDEEGVEFATVVEMQQDAILAAGSMVAERTTFPSEPWAMNIRDDDFKTIAILTFSAVQAGKDLAK